MIVTFYSFVMATVMGSIFILIYAILKRRLVFILSFGPESLLFLAALCFLRTVLPFEFPKYQYKIEIDLSNISNHWYAISIKTLKILTFIIIIGSVFLLAKMIYHQVQLKQYLNSSPDIKNEDAEILLYRIDPSHKLRLRQISGISVPMVAGLLKPTIYLPDVPYTKCQLKYILLHEYTHWKNKDLWVKFIVYTILIFFWWNPFVHLLFKNLNETLELKCDYTATNNLNTKEKVQYLETLLYSVKNLRISSQPTKGIVSSELINATSKTFIKHRFQLILSTRTAASVYKVSKILLSIVSILFILISYIFIVQPCFKTPDNELWTTGVDYVADSKNSYVEKTLDGYYYFHMDNLTCIEIPKEDIDMGYYSDYPIRYLHTTHAKHTFNEPQPEKH